MRVGQAEVLDGTVLDEEGLVVQAGALEEEVVVVAVEGADQTVGRVVKEGMRRAEQVMKVDHEIPASLEESVAVGD